MYTQYQKSLSIVVLTSLMLQSCSGNLLSSEYRHPVKEERAHVPIHTTQPAAAAQSTVAPPEFSSRSRDGLLQAAPSTEATSAPSTPSREQPQRPPSLATWSAHLQEKIEALGKTHPQKASILSQKLLGGYRGTKVQQEALATLGINPPDSALLPGLKGGMRKAWQHPRTLRSVSALGQSTGSMASGAPHQEGLPQHVAFLAWSTRLGFLLIGHPSAAHSYTQVPMSKSMDIIAGI